MEVNKKSQIKKRIENVLKYKQDVIHTAYSKSLEELIEELKIYQYELEFQNEELQRVQEELELSRDQYRQLFFHAPMGYVVLDTEYLILDCNDTFRKIVLPIEPCKPKNDFRRFIEPASQDRFHFFWKELTESGSAASIEINLLNLTGEPIVVQMHGVFRKEGGAPKVLLALLDITEQYHARANLAASESKFNTLVTRMSQGLALHRIICNDKGVPVDYLFLDVNQTYESMTGLKRQEVIGKSVLEIFPGLDDIWISQFGKVALTGVPVSFESYSTPLKKFFSVTAYQNRPGEFAVIVTDISGRKVMEDELNKQRQMLDLALDASSTAVWELNLETMLLSAQGDEALRQLTEKTAEEFRQLEPKDWQTMIYSEDLEQVRNAIIHASSQADALQVVRCRVQRPDGSLVWVELKGRLTGFDETGKPVILSGIINDISARVAADELIVQKNNELALLNSEKDKLFSIIAHDLRSPFNNLLGMTNLLLDELQDMSVEEIRQSATMLQHSSSVLFRLIENLLQWARIQLGSLNVEPVETDLLPLVEESLLLVHEFAVKKNIDIQNHILQGIPLVADPNILQTVLRNLLFNAVKFTHKGGIVSITAFIRDEHELVVKIKDNGVGMKPESLENLFEKLDRSTSRGTAGESGTGLGLILCKELIERHQGRIWATSEPGKGSTFSFSFPLDIRKS